MVRLRDLQVLQWAAVAIGITMLVSCFLSAILYAAVQVFQMW